MKKHFWKISALACAAVVSACAVTASAASDVNSSRWGKCFSESGEECPIITDEEIEAMRKQKEAEYHAAPEHTVAPYMLETTERGLTVYEEALLAGDYSLGCGTVECSGNHTHPMADTSQEKGRNAAAASGTKITLDEVDDVSYTLWSGRYTYYGNLSNFQWYSNTPNCFEIQGYGPIIMMHSFDDYKTLYKRASIQLTYLKDGKITYVTPPAVEGTEQDIYAYATPGSGELVEIAAFFYIYDASSPSTGFREVAMVHILHSNYVPRAVKNNEPYAHLIDMYTSI